MLTITAVLYFRISWKKHNQTLFQTIAAPSIPSNPCNGHDDHPSAFSKPALSCTWVQTWHLYHRTASATLQLWGHPGGSPQPPHPVTVTRPEKHLSCTTFHSSVAPGSATFALHEHLSPQPLNAEQLHQVCSQHTACILWVLHTLCKAREQERFYG